MNFPFYRVQGNDIWSQVQYISQVLEHREIFENKYKPRKTWGKSGNELFNICQLACKCTMLCYSMTLKDFHNLFIGRMGPNGNEMEIREVVLILAQTLHLKYPQFILDPSQYLELANDSKYKPASLNSTDSKKNNNNDNNNYTNVSLYTQGLFRDSVVTLGEITVKVVGTTEVSKEAKALFKSLNINVDQPDDFALLTEFRSRITYLAFPESEESLEDARKYNVKLINEYHHYSVLAGCQIVIEIVGLGFTDETKSFVGLLQQKLGLVTLDAGRLALVITVKDLYSCVQNLSGGGVKIVEDTISALKGIFYLFKM